ncbi:MAG: PAS domain-containing protein, partial [Eubacterium sp.]
MQFDSLFLDRLPTAVFIFEDVVDFTVIHANEHFYKTIGYTKADFNSHFGNRISAIGNIEDLARVNSALSENKSDEATLHTEGRIKKKNGQITRLALHFSHFEDGYICVATDLKAYLYGSVSTNIANARLARILKRSSMDAFSYDFATRRMIWCSGSFVDFPSDSNIDVFKYFEDKGILHPEDAKKLETVLDDFKTIPESFIFEGR